MPHFLAWIARVLPLTHALARVRYGLLDDSSGLHHIWRLHGTTAMAGLSLLVVGAFAVLLTTAGVRVFARTAVR